MSGLMFDLPPELAADGPPAQRDLVRLLVADTHQIRHARFRDLNTFLRPGDLVVVNTSGTLAAAVTAHRADGRAVAVHFSTDLGAGQWVVEVRPGGPASGPVLDIEPGERLHLAGGVELVVREPYPADQPTPRLWRCTVPIEGGVPAYLARRGRPIRYPYVRTRVGLRAYQTIFAGRPGSAEMPSAGRPFSPRVVTDLVRDGIVLAPITLHTGVSSQEVGEPPLAERFEVPEATARLVESTRAAGRRVVAVGTTVTRALESAAGSDGCVRATAGWTDLVLGPARPARVVTGLITGWHAPGASHLELLQAVAGADLVERAYREALRQRYLWHEFGDSCLLLP